MSEKKIGYVGSSDGSVIKYDPKAHAPAERPKLTRHQRATLYFKAVRFIEKLFRDVGFTHVTPDSHGNFVLELGGARDGFGHSFVIEMKVEQPPPMAHVTSYPGYAYDSKQINAKVTFGSVGSGAPGEYVIRVIGTTPGMKTLRPVYVVVSPDSVNPLREAFMSALMAAHELIKHDPATLERIKAALASRNLNRDFERYEVEEQDSKTASVRR